MEIPVGRTKVEAYVETATQASAAVAAGAARLELCGAGEGGVTPDGGTIDAVIAGAVVPVHIMIRPRSGDFVYSSAEFAQMRVSIASARSSGVDGLVFGVLRTDGALDIDRMSELVGLARPLHVVCHRAFDRTPDADAALDTLLALGVDGVLTSGHARTALEGAPTIARHIERAGSRLEVIAGGSVRADHAPALLDATRGRWFHARGTDAAVISALTTALATAAKSP